MFGRIEVAKKMIENGSLFSEDSKEYESRVQLLFNLNEDIAASELSPTQKVDHYLLLLCGYVKERNEQAKSIYLKLIGFYVEACPEGTQDSIKVKLAELKANSQTRAATLSSEFSAKLKLQ